jgi:hypothetical protein
MIVVNLIAVIILATISYFYLKLRTKQKINFLFLVIIFSLPPIVSIFRKGTYESGDLSLHTYRAIAFFYTLQEGIFFPQWAGKLNATYGYPLFIFAPPLPYYITSFFHFLGVSFLNSLKLLLALSFIGSGITMYYWAKEEFGRLPGFIASVFYLYSPYHLVDLHFRANPGEVLAFMFFPLSMLATKQVIHKSNLIWIFTLAVSIGLLILSHPIALILLPFIICYSILLLYKENKYWKNILKLLFSFIFGFSLSLFYWLPEITLGKYTLQKYFHHEVFFPQIQEFIYSPWRYGLLFQGSKGELSFVIGYAQLTVVILLVIFLIKKRSFVSNKLIVYFFLVSFLIIFSLMQSLSKPLWSLIPLLENLQFSYRMLLLMNFITAGIAGIVTMKIKNKILLTSLIAFAVLSTILNWGNRRTIPEITSDLYFEKQLSLSTFAGEGGAPAAPKWLDPKNLWQKEIPAKNLEVIEGNASIIKLSNTSTKREYVVSVLMPTQFKENTLYFPGWYVYVNNRPIKVNYNDPRYQGIITFNLVKGLYKVDVLYIPLKIQQISQIISIIAWITASFIILYISFANRLKYLFKI